MRFDDGAEGVLIGRAHEVLADETAVFDAVLVRPVVVFDTDIEFAGGVVQRFAEVVLDLRVEVEVLLQSMAKIFEASGWRRENSILMRMYSARAVAGSSSTVRSSKAVSQSSRMCRMTSTYSPSLLLK